MKYVYVLISTREDYYYEQCLISITSLKYRMPNAKVIVLTDTKTELTLTGKRSDIKELGVEILSIEFPEEMSNKVRSRKLKTQVRKLVKGDFLYIDLDTIIMEELEEIEKCSADLAFVLDKHSIISEHYMYMYMYNNAKKMNWHVGIQNMHFNSGVMLVRDTSLSHFFFELWTSLYEEGLKKGISIDQTALNEANYRMGGVICELSGIWNVQISCGLKYLYKGKILHYLGYQPQNRQKKYFNTLPFFLCDSNLLDEVKTTGNVKSVLNIIECPKEAFKNVYILPDDCVAYPLLFSNHMRVLKFIYIKVRPVYCLFEKLYQKLFEGIFRRT